MNQVPTGKQKQKLIYSVGQPARAEIQGLPANMYFVIPATALFCHSQTAENTSLTTAGTSAVQMLHPTAETETHLWSLPHLAL